MTAMFGYRAPTSRAELLTLLADHGGGARVLAGGTDLLGDVRSGLARPDVMVDVKKVAGFADLTWSADDGLVISPAVTINDILLSARVRESFPLLVACAEDLASHQIRNRATVIGNVANASPCADMSPALLCLGATVVLSSADGSRELPIAEFFTGAKQTVVAAAEVIERIVIPPQSADARGSYRKLKHPVGGPREAEAVGHDQGRSPAHQPPQGRHHDGLALGVHGARRFVKEEDGGPREQRPRNGEALALASAEAHATLAHHRP